VLLRNKIVLLPLSLNEDELKLKLRS